MSTSALPKSVIHELICPRCGALSKAALGQRCPQDNARLVITAHLQRGARFQLLGQNIDGYDLVGVLGGGGFGLVYLAIEERLERHVALKVIRPERREQHGLRRRFFREAQAIASLGGEQIVRLLKYGEYDPTQGDQRQEPCEPLLYMAMEFVQGLTLKQMVIKDGPFAPERVRELGRQLLAGLAGAHKMGILHRDLKPDNIMLVQNALGQEKLKILDFGVAKLLEPEEEPGDITQLQTQAGLVLGTPRYMAPDRALGFKESPATDIYAVGLLFFYMLYGYPPFDAPSRIEIVNAQAHSPLPPLHGLDAELEALLLRALKKKPQERFPDAQAMFEALNCPVTQVEDGPTKVMTVPREDPLASSATAYGSGTCSEGSALSATTKFRKDNLAQLYLVEQALIRDSSQPPFPGPISDPEPPIQQERLSTEQSEAEREQQRLIQQASTQLLMQSPEEEEALSLPWQLSILSGTLMVLLLFFYGLLG